MNINNKQQVNSEDKGPEKPFPKKVWDWYGSRPTYQLIILVPGTVVIGGIGIWVFLQVLSNMKSDAHSTPDPEDSEEGGFMPLAKGLINFFKDNSETSEEATQASDSETIEQATQTSDSDNAEKSVKAVDTATELVSNRSPEQKNPNENEFSKDDDGSTKDEKVFSKDEKVFSKDEKGSSKDEDGSSKKD